MGNQGNLVIVFLTGYYHSYFFGCITGEGDTTVHYTYA